MSINTKLIVDGERAKDWSMEKLNINPIMPITRNDAKHSRIVWLCLCECGQTFLLDTAHMKRRRTCGRCKFARELHGSYNTPEYVAFQGAKSRCRNSKCTAFKDYGGRGIEFKFTSFEQFLKELGKRPEGMSLDRKDTNGHYESGNVHWAVFRDQMLNRRAYKAIENFTDEEISLEVKRRGL